MVIKRFNKLTGPGTLSYKELHINMHGSLSEILHTYYTTAYLSYEERITGKINTITSCICTNSIKIIG